MTDQQLPVLTASLARTAADAALSTAAELGASISVAIVDAQGHDLLVIRSDKARWFTPGVARAKAGTAVAMGTSTRELSSVSEAFPELLPLVEQQLTHPLTTLAGGLPLRAAGTTVGAIGVSGAHPDIDEQCAQAGASAVAI